MNQGLPSRDPIADSKTGVVTPSWQQWFTALESAMKGHDGTVSVVTSVRLNAGAIQVKTTALTFASGVLSSVGQESNWT